MARIFNASTGTRPTGWALSRSTSATYVNSSGNVATASSGVERLNYSTAGALLGLLVEPAAANLSLQGESIGTTPWDHFETGSGATSITLNAATAPDGSTTASLISLNRSTTGDYAEVYQVLSTAAGNYVKSDWIKAATSGDVGKTINFGIYDGGSLSAINHTLTSGWSRIAVNRGMAASSGSQTILGYIVGGGLSGTGAVGFHAWGDQTETGLTPTSLIPTTTGTGSRAADDYSFTLAPGATQLTFTFDDATTQLITGLTGGTTYHIPTSLDRPNVLYIDDDTTGGTGGSASGATITATASVIAGTATGGSSGAGNAIGSTVTATSSVIPGTATGGASASGSTITATASVIGGTATGAGGGATAPGDLVTAAAFVLGGTAHASSAAPGQLVVATTSILPGIAREVRPGGSMSITTLSNILTRVETRLSLMGGLDVQTYGQPKLVEIIQGAFNDAFRMRFWKLHLVQEQFTLNGTTGKVNVALDTKIKAFEDIKFIWMPGYQSPLAEGPYDINPALINSPCFMAYGDPSSVFQVFPNNTTGQITVSYRTFPANYALNDVVMFDQDYLMYETCAQYLIFEGANTMAAKDMRDKAEKRLKLLMQLEEKNEKSMYSVGATTQDMWRDA